MSKPTNVTVTRSQQGLECHRQSSPVRFRWSEQHGKPTAASSNSVTSLCDFSLARVRRSSTFDSVVKFVIGRKFLKSPASRPSFLSSGVTSPAFQVDGKRPATNDAFAMCVMMAENSRPHDLTTEIGSWSSGDVLIGADLTSLLTSASVTRVKDCMTDAAVTDGSLADKMLPGALRRPSSTLFLTCRTLSMMKSRRPDARLVVSSTSYHAAPRPVCRSCRTVFQSSRGVSATCSTSPRRYSRIVDQCVGLTTGIALR